MGTIARHLALVLLLTGSVPALADEARPTPEAEHRTLESFADANKDCREWTDGCAICLRREDGTLACSLPGIACEPTPIVCKPPPASQPDVTPSKDAPKDSGAPKDTGTSKPTNPPNATPGATTPPPEAGAPTPSAPKAKDPL